MSRLKELKNYVKEHIPQIVGTIAGIIAVLLIGAIVILSISDDEKDKSKVTSAEKSASENITSEKNTTQKSTTKKTPETTIENKTSDEETTDEEKTDKETTTKESTTKNSQVIQYTTLRVLETTKSQETTVQQTTAKKQEATTKKTEKPTTPPRGKNGVILEELSFIRRQGITNVPKTYTEAKENVTVPGSIPGYTILYTSPNLIQDNIFGNEITFKETTESQVISIYGQPLTSYYDNNKNKYSVYQYGYYANGEKDEIIYITFGYANAINMKLGAVGIASAEYTKIEGN